MVDIPLGYRFSPDDQELVGYFLLKKLNGGLSPEEAELVRECDLYGKEEPWVLFQKLKNDFSGGDVFVFTELKCKDKGKKNIDRRIGGGCWHGEDSGKEVAVNGQIKAKKKRFSYKNKGSDHSGSWILHEYSLPNCPIVLCRLRHKSSDLDPESESNDGPRLDFDFFESFKAADINVEGSHKRRRLEFENPTDMEGNNAAATAQPELTNNSDSPAEKSSNLESSHGADMELNNGSVKRRRLEFNNSGDNHTAAEPDLRSNNPVDSEGHKTTTADSEKWKAELKKVELALEQDNWDFEALINGSSTFDIDYDAFFQDVPTLIDL